MTDAQQTIEKRVHAMLMDLTPVCGTRANGPYMIVRALKGDNRFWKPVTCPKCLKRRKDAA